MHGYTSTDGVHWEYDGVALSRHRDETDGAWTGSLWECPQVFEADGAWVMLTSVWEAGVTHYAAYALGDFDEGRFTARAWGRLTYGTHYAPTVFRDAAGRPCMMTWLREVRGEDWTGCLSLPYVLRVDGDRLVATQHPDVDAHAPRGTQGRFVWSPGDPPDLAARVAIDAAGGELRLRTGDTTTAMPHDGGPVEIFVDDEVVEVCGPLGLLGGPTSGVSDG